MNLRELQQQLKRLSCAEQYPELAEKIRESAEIQRCVLSQPSAAEAFQAEMQRAMSRAQRQGQDMQMKVQAMISDENAKE